MIALRFPQSFHLGFLTQVPFSIPFLIEKMKIERALCDLGAIISLMPYSMFHKLHLGLLWPAPFSLQLANGSETRPLDTLEDAHVKIENFWILEDFIVANMTETVDAEIVLGRPFVATSVALLMQRGTDNIWSRGLMLHFVLWIRKLFPPILSYLMCFPFS